MTTNKGKMAVEKTLDPIFMNQETSNAAKQLCQPNETKPGQGLGVGRVAADCSSVEPTPSSLVDFYSAAIRPSKVINFSNCPLNAFKNASPNTSCEVDFEHKHRICLAICAV